MNTLQSVSKIINCSICDSKEICNAFKARLGEGLPTRDENTKTHFCVYFLPFNPKNKKVFIVHHKKSGLWLSPGGHVDKGETILEALNQEIDEELGVKNFFKETPPPFLLTITPIENPIQPCKVHYDVWCLVLTDGGNFNVDPREFHNTKWLAIEEAGKIVTDSANIKALEIIGNKYK